MRRPAPPIARLAALAALVLLGCGPLAVPRAYHRGAPLHDGGVLVVGGGRSYPPTAIVARYHPDLARWRHAAPLPEGRQGHSVTLLPDGRVLLAGGRGLDVEPLRSALLYDPDTDRWRDAAPMLAPRDGHAAALLADGRVLVVAGDPSDPSAELYDPAQGRWSAVAPLPGGARRHSATTLIDGRVLVVGDLDSVDRPYLYDPRADAWQLTAPLAEPRAFHRATRLADGRVAVIGGRRLGGPDDLTHEALASIELFDPLTDAWTPGPSLCHARSVHTATRLGDDIIVVGGVPSGFGAERAIPHAERIDLARRAVVDLGRVVGPRAAHTATLLEDGAIMVVGGRRRVLFNTWARRYARAVELDLGERPPVGERRCR